MYLEGEDAKEQILLTRQIKKEGQELQELIDKLNSGELKLQGRDYFLKKYSEPMKKEKPQENKKVNKKQESFDDFLENL